MIMEIGAICVTAIEVEYPPEEIITFPVREPDPVFGLIVT
jgi:hypothetical protein